jgi:transcriptional regulator with XRE-family HTH domain
MLEIHQWIEYTRKSHLLSKQEMAERLEISTRTYSKMLHTKKVSDRFLNRLSVDWNFNPIDQTLFDELNHKLTLIYRNILYVDYTKAKELVIELTAYKSLIEHSTLVKTFYLYMFMYLTHTQDMVLDIDYIEHQCEILEPFMNQEEKNLYYIVLNGYHYVKGDFNKSFDIGLSNILKVSNPHLKGLSYFLLGASLVNEVGQIEKALEYLKQGQTIFETYANYARVQRCQAFILVGLVHSRRYHEFFEGYALFQEIPVLEEDRTRVFNFIEGTKARYYMLINKPKEALEILNLIKEGASSNQFLKLIANMQLENWEAVKIIINIEKTDKSIENRYHRQLLEIIETYLLNHDHKTYTNNLIKLIQDIEASRDFISIMLVSEVVAKACLKARMFKDAHQIKNNKLALLI